MNQQERDELRANSDKVTAIGVELNAIIARNAGGEIVMYYGLIHQIMPFALGVAKHVPALLDEVERLEAENATLHKQLELAAKWVRFGRKQGLDDTEDANDDN